MHIIIVILALLLVGLPILTGILRIVGVLFSAAFHFGGKLLLIALALVGIYIVFMVGPIAWVIAAIVFIVFRVVKS